MQQIVNRFFAGAKELAEGAAADFLEAIRGRADQDQIGIALSGGRIASTFYRAIVERAKTTPVSLAKTHFFWADERCVPPSDRESNFTLAQEHLFEPLNVPPAHIHRVLGETDPGFAAAQAEAEICRILPLNDLGQPSLDLVVLGMGEDGHVASLFPSEGGEAVEDTRVYRHVVASKPPPSRITLGYKAIIQAKEVWVLASGAGKGDALEAALRGDLSLPITRILQARSETKIYQDIKKF